MCVCVLIPGDAPLRERAAPRHKREILKVAFEEVLRIMKHHGSKSNVGTQAGHSREIAQPIS